MYKHRKKQAEENPYIVQLAVTSITSIIGIIFVLIISFYPLINYEHHNNIRKLIVDENHIRIRASRFGPEGTDYLDSKSEFAQLLFTLDADFTPFLNWNTRQVLVSIIAEYQTNDYSRNLIVIWDKIITRKEEAHLRLYNVSNAYPLVDIRHRWNFEKVTLSLLWDKTPFFGTIKSGKMNNASYFIIPSSSTRLTYNHMM